MSDRLITVAHYGLGPIGAEALRIVAAQPWLRIVGAVDIDPAKVGRDAGAVAGLAEDLGIRVDDDAERLLAQARPAVVVHCTGSSLAGVLPQLRGIVRAGAGVVSTCEELSYPWARHRAQAEELDALARSAGVAVLGTGVNPGFVMDLLPLVLSAVTARVSSVRVTRVVDAARRRGPLQRKIGAGITPEEFRHRAAEGRIGHVGLGESLDMLAAGLGWELQGTEGTLEPVLAREAVETPYARVAPGGVAGIHQIARGHTAAGQDIALDLTMYVGAPDPRDEVVIEGEPGARLLIPGGIFGDSATAAIVANAIPAVYGAAPGLRIMRDLPANPHRPAPSPTVITESPLAPGQE